MRLWLVAAVRTAIVMFGALAIVRLISSPSLSLGLIIAGIIAVLVLFDRLVLLPVAMHEQSRDSERV